MEKNTISVDRNTLEPSPTNVKELFNNSNNNTEDKVKAEAMRWKNSRRSAKGIIRYTSSKNSNFINVIVEEVNWLNVHRKNEMGQYMQQLNVYEKSSARKIVQRLKHTAIWCTATEHVLKERIGTEPEAMDRHPWQLKTKMKVQKRKGKFSNSKRMQNDGQNADQNADRYHCAKKKMCTPKVHYVTCNKLVISTQTGSNSSHSITSSFILAKIVASKYLYDGKGTRSRHPRRSAGTYTQFYWQCARGMIECAWWCH